MTTIAYRDGVMAADRRVISGSWISYDDWPKLYRLSDGAVAGISCTGSQWPRKFVNWYNAVPRREPLDLKGECWVLVAHPEGWLRYYCGDGYEDMTGRLFECTGSGWPAARAAMLMGADARRAVEIAALCNPETGGKIDVMRVRE